MVTYKEYFFTEYCKYCFSHPKKIDGQVDGRAKSAFEEKLGESQVDVAGSDIFSPPAAFEVFRIGAVLRPRIKKASAF
jgi:hypothetical protein